MSLADTFRVVDGVLTVAYDGYGLLRACIRHLFHATLHAYYRMRFEYRFAGEQARDRAGPCATAA